MGTQDEFIRTQIRIPPDLHSQIKKAQETSGRSFNAEIVSRLEVSFKQEADKPLADLIREILREELSSRGL